MPRASAAAEAQDVRRLYQGRTEFIAGRLCFDEARAEHAGASNRCLEDCDDC